MIKSTDFSETKPKESQTEQGGGPGHTASAAFKNLLTGFDRNPHHQLLHISQSRFDKIQKTYLAIVVHKLVSVHCGSTLYIICTIFYAFSGNLEMI